MIGTLRTFLTLLFLGTACLLASTDGPCVSGLAPGQRPGPYSSVVCVGAQRGQSHCYICETEDRPAVVVFARTLDDSLAKLVRGLDKALVEHKAADLRAWVTFLAEDQSALDAKILDWAKKQAVKNIPLAVFEDIGGPPSYKLSRDADVTVLLFVKQKVVRNFAYRAGELKDERIADVLKAVPEIVSAEKKQE
jgi:hypothetical protein